MPSAISENIFSRIPKFVLWYLSNIVMMTNSLIDWLAEDDSYKLLGSQLDV
jgi:hypothetical protein